MAPFHTPPTKTSSILIIGAGTFGTSTAYHLAKRGYNNITCIDRHAIPSADSAGFDLNKVVRTEYDEPLYTKLALEALDAWRQPEWKGIFHETGRLTTTTGDAAIEKHMRESYENLKSLGRDSQVKLVEGRRQIEELVPQLKSAHGVETWKGSFNPHGGWVHARKALEKWGVAARDMGVKFLSGAQGTMTGLQIDSHGQVCGIDVQSGDILTADKYVLATGAASPQLLPELLAPHLWSKCWTLGHVELSEKEVEQWQGVPVLDHHELGFAFEPDPETKRIKVCNNFPGYQNLVGSYKDASGKTHPFSVPRYASDHPADGIPKEAEDGIKKYIDIVMPQFSGRPLLDARICWCTDTADQHWLIDFHPQYPNLLLATGDSGHAFKMLPIIGDYISDALECKERGLKPEWKYGERTVQQYLTRPDAEVKDVRDALGVV